MVYRGYDPFGRRPEYDNPSEREAYFHGYEDGFFGRVRNLIHPFINAYSKGYWNGHHDDGEASTHLKER